MIGPANRPERQDRQFRLRWLSAPLRRARAMPAPVNDYSQFVGPRTLIRALVVAGLLLLVFTWRLDQAVGTAYDTRWFAPSETGTPLNCDSCLRLPTSKWVRAHWLATVIAFALLLGAAFFFRHRCAPGRQLRL